MSFVHCHSFQLTRTGKSRIEGKLKDGAIAQWHGGSEGESGGSDLVHLILTLAFDFICDQGILLALLPGSQATAPQVTQTWCQCGRYPRFEVCLR